MDAHTHLTMEMDDDYKQRRLDGLEKPVAELAIEATVYARKELMAGFTTCRDVGSSDSLDVGSGTPSGTARSPARACSWRCTPIGATGGHCDDEAGYRAGVFGRETGIEDGVAKRRRRDAAPPSGTTSSTAPTSSRRARPEGFCR